MRPNPSVEMRPNGKQIRLAQPTARAAVLRMPSQYALVEIDAPEKRQAFGARSKQSLSDLVFGKPVTVETDKKDWQAWSMGRC